MLVFRLWHSSIWSELLFETASPRVFREVPLAKPLSAPSTEMENEVVLAPFHSTMPHDLQGILRSQIGVRGLQMLSNERIART